MSETKKDNDRFEFHGVKLAHELMVDIMGALIPGALFLFCIIICIVFPIICYSTQGNNFGFLVKDGDWFWIIAFLSFLILSYVLGMIFYRADIKVPDRADIRREQEKKLISFLKGLPKQSDTKNKTNQKANKRTDDNESDNKSNNYDSADTVKYVANLLIQEIEPLKEHLVTYKDINQDVPNKDKQTNNKHYNEAFSTCCKETLEFLYDILEPKDSKELEDNYSKLDDQKQQSLLGILFPEKGTKAQTKDSSKQDDAKQEDAKQEDVCNIFSILHELPLSAQSVMINTIKIVPIVDEYFKGKSPEKIKIKRVKNNLIRLSKKRKAISSHYKIANSNILFYQLMVCYLILHLQNESGCATEERCDFPYMSYYKYLLKRGQFDLLRYVDWSTSAARTKNCINQYKIELQLHEPHAYSIISKNESHIRMASSTWHVAEIIKRISTIIICVFTAFAIAGLVFHFTDPIVDSNKGANKAISEMTSQKTDVTSRNDMSANENQLPINQTEKDIISNSNDSNEDNKNNESNNSIISFFKRLLPFIDGTSLTNEYLAVLFPFLTLLLSIYIIDNVPKFIHYQRLREIFYTLKTYKLWKDSKCKYER